MEPKTPQRIGATIRAQGEKVEALRKDTAEVLDRAREAIARARAIQAASAATFSRIIRCRGRGA
jgi:hypothetical protein